MRSALLVLPLVAACKVTDPPPITSAFTDEFERPELGDLYLATGDGYRLHAGALSAHGAHGHPLWLRRRLPAEFRIDLDCGSTEARGDIEVEVDGDGHSFATATGYEEIFGGGSNSRSRIARLDEHGKNVVERTLPEIVPNQRYHWRIERRGGKLTWWIDDLATPFLVYDDPDPLTGEDHAYFAFDNRETDTWFDNLVITPL
jgi:hypothetical protein